MSEHPFLPQASRSLRFLGAGFSRALIGSVALSFLPVGLWAEEAGEPEITTPSSFYAAEGPWGKLRCTHIHLEAPDQLISSFPVPGPIPRWSFPLTMEEKLSELFRSAGMSEAFVSRVLSPDRVVREGSHIHLFPPILDLESMSPESRLIIYTQLANHPVNQFHADPVLIIGETVEECYRGSGLREELISKIKQLSYSRGGVTAFSDPSVVIHHCSGEKEIKRFMKAMTRTRSIMVRLELNQDSNVDEILNYWSLGLGLRMKDIEPILNSIIGTNGIESLSISQLLPPLARKLLYTYPGIELARNGVFPDCHWTSLNFFNYEPKDYLLDASFATSAVLEGFEKVDPPYRYGDILMFVDRQTGSAFHSCVHLADNLVYTKNGRNILSPWVIMARENVQLLYMYKGESRVQGYRVISD